MTISVSNRVGGGIAPAVLSHHRTCGSAYGGSCLLPAYAFHIESVSCIVSSDFCLKHLKHLPGFRPLLFICRHNGYPLPCVSVV